MTSRFLTRAGILMATLCLLLAGAAAARAEEVKVTAAFDDVSADVGQPVNYTITVNGATDATVPENIDVDGLTITYSGPSTQTQINFGSAFGSGTHIQRSVVHSYSVVPGRAGNFVIPAQQVTVDGKVYTTQAVNLRVGGAAASGGGSGGGGGEGQGADGNGPLYYAEFVLPRDTVYIGEALPIEIRLYVDARVRAQLLEMPEITAEGCTVQKVDKPSQSQVTRYGGNM